LLKLSRALLVFGLLGFALVTVAARAIQIARELFIVDFQFMERADLFGVVLAAEDLTGFDGLPFAAAEFREQPLPWLRLEVERSPDTSNRPRRRRRRQALRALIQTRQDRAKTSASPKI
jgi:hypothetical protein